MLVYFPLSLFLSPSWHHCPLHLQFFLPLPSAFTLHLVSLSNDKPPDSLKDHTPSSTFHHSFSSYPICPPSSLLWYQNANICPQFLAQSSWDPWKKKDEISLLLPLLSCMKSLSRVRLFATPWTVVLPGSSIHGILQARVLEWVAISFSRGSSQPRDRTRVSCIGGRCFNLWATRELYTLN